MAAKKKTTRKPAARTSEKARFDTRIVNGVECVDVYNRAPRQVGICGAVVQLMPGDNPVPLSKWLKVADDPTTGAFFERQKVHGADKPTTEAPILSYGVHGDLDLHVTSEPKGDEST